MFKPIGKSQFVKPRDVSAADNELTMQDSSGRDEYGPNAFFAQNPLADSRHSRGRIGSVIGGRDSVSNLQSRRGSMLSSSQNGGASLRNKISGSLKQRVETFRRMSTKKMKKE